MIGASMAVRPPRSRGPVLMMIDALRRIGGSLWMVDTAFSGAFVDNVGTTPVTAYGDLLGLATDRLGVLGPNLCPNGTFDNGATDWSIPAGWVLGSGVATATTASGSLKQISTPYIANKTYQVEFDWSHTSGTLYVRVGTGAAVTFNTSGRKSAVLVAVNAAGVEFYGGAVSGSIDNISVRELTGNHATKSAVASKPSVQRVPKRTRGPVNQLLWSGDFSNASWTKAGATVVTGQADPLGGTSAAKLVESATNSAHYFLQSVVSGTGTATSAWVVKPAGRTKIQIRSESPQTGMLATMFNLATGAIQNGTGSIVALDNGFFLCFATAPSNGTGANGYHLMQTLSGSWQETYTGDGTSGVIVYRAALFTGTLTAQQILDNGGIPLTTTTALPNVLEWATVISFDGSNDFLQTGITTGNEGWVCAGVSLNSLAANQVVLSSGAQAAGDPGLSLKIRSTGSVWAGRANASTVDICASSASAVAVGVPCVIDADYTTAGATVRKDGVVIATSAVAVTAFASTNTLRIGAVAGASPTEYLSAALHAKVYTTVIPSAADRATIRNGIAALQGRTL